MRPQRNHSSVMPGRLRACAPFDALSAEQLIVTAGYATAVHYADGETILEHGSNDECDYFLLEGEVELEDADRQRTRIGSTAAAATTALASARPSLYVVRARGSTTLARVPRATVAVLREQLATASRINVAELERTLSQTQDLAEQIKSDIASDRLRLPSQPDLALRLREAIGRSTCTNSMVAELVAIDPAIAAKVMKIANSPLCRGREAVTSLVDAVSRIGMFTVTELVICFSLKDVFRTGDRRLRKVFSRYVGEAVRIGACSSVIAARVAPQWVDQALIAGLLCNIGAYPVLERLAARDDGAAAGAEADALGADVIARIGALICERWHFDPAIVAAVRHGSQWDYAPAGETDLAAIVVSARFHAWIGLGADYRARLPQPAAVPALRCLEPWRWPQDSEAIVQQAKERVDALLSALC